MTARTVQCVAVLPHAGAQNVFSCYRMCSVVSPHARGEAAGGCCVVIEGDPGLSLMIYSTIPSPSSVLLLELLIL